MSWRPFRRGRDAVREYRTVAGLPRSPSGSRNVVLIVWDTVRAYNLGLYGYFRDTTPNLSRWAQKGVKYNRALAPAPWTYPSHSCFFTGQWPFRINSQWKLKLDTPDPTLAEYLRLTGLSDRRVFGEHQLLHLRDWAGSGLRPFRGLLADADVPPDAHGSREMAPREPPGSWRLPRPESRRFLR